MIPAIILIIVIVFVIYIISFKNKHSAQLKKKVEKHLGGKTLLYGENADLFNGSKMQRGFLALTKEKLIFIADEPKEDKVTTLLELKYEEIISHKLHFVIFVEAPDHRVYEIKSKSNMKAYQIICEKCK